MAFTENEHNESGNSRRQQQTATAVALTDIARRTTVTTSKATATARTGRWRHADRKTNHVLPAFRSHLGASMEVDLAGVLHACRVACGHGGEHRLGRWHPLLQRARRVLGWSAHARALNAGRQLHIEDHNFNAVREDDVMLQPGWHAPSFRVLERGSVAHLHRLLDWPPLRQKALQRTWHPSCT